MKKYLILLVLSIVVAPAVLGQIENETNWQFSFYGDMLIHPGIEVGYQLPLKNWQKIKSKKGVEKSKNKSLNTGLDFIYYWHKSHHHGLALNPYVSYQRTKQNGRYFQGKLSLGFHRSFVDGTTYLVDEHGNVASKYFSGQNSLYTSIAFDFGKDLRFTRDIPLRWFFQIGLSGRYPYNRSYLPSIHTGIGIHYFIKR